MQLTHLGASYTAANQAIETVETDTELCFMGRSFKMRAPKVASRPAASDRLTYRGVSYTA
jgi:hypothetical protein